MTYVTVTEIFVSLLQISVLLYLFQLYHLVVTIPIHLNSMHSHTKKSVFF